MIRTNKKTLVIILGILLLITTGILGYCIVNKINDALSLKELLSNINLKELPKDVNVKELVEDINSIRKNGEIIHAKEKEPYTIPSTLYGDGYWIVTSIYPDYPDCNDQEDCLVVGYSIYVNDEEIWTYKEKIKQGE